MTKFEVRLIFECKIDSLDRDSSISKEHLKDDK